MSWRYIIILFILSVSILSTDNSIDIAGTPLQAGNQAPNSETLQANQFGPTFPVENIRPGWWESSGLIYYKIPARILFKSAKTNPIAPEKISENAWAEFDRIGKIFNPFDSTSEVSRLNRLKKTGKIQVSRDIFRVLSISRDLWIAGNGDFDPTLLKIKNLWQHAEKIQQIPTEKEILNEMQATGFEKVHMADTSERTIWTDHAEIMFDFGGIVKGYAVDHVRDLLIAQGATTGLVQLGGEVSTFGDNDENPWRVGIEHPKHMGKIWGVISTRDRLSVSTSGNYMQPIIIEGHSFYHIFNPKTGKPVSEKVLGVTTASMNGKTPNAVLDGAATTIVVLGGPSGIKFAESLGIDALILFENKDGGNGELHTPGFVYEKNIDN
jgi:FAD:protein FMN transferase